MLLFYIAALPLAAAKIYGSAAYPDLGGQVSFYATPYDGVLVSAEIYGLPDSQAPIASGFFGMHIHENGICASSFDTAGGHDIRFSLRVRTQSEKLFQDTKKAENLENQGFRQIFQRPRGDSNTRPTA